jgi:hypothetical protein
VELAGPSSASFEAELHINAGFGRQATSEAGKSEVFRLPAQLSEAVHLMRHVHPAALWAILLAGIGAASLPSTALAADRQDFRGEYTVSFLGLAIAKATFESRYENNAYAIHGGVSSAGLARIFDDTRGTISTSGRIGGDRIEPAAFRADYTSGKKVSLIDIRFAGSKVVSTQVLPPPKPRGADWLPLGAADLAGVADPIAATVIRAGSPDKVCGRTVKLYDGEMRADLVLSYVEKGTIAVKGYEGPTVTCRLNFEPVSGYRKGRKALEFLKKKSRIKVTFAPIGQTGIYAPIHATVGTEIGTITIRARQFEATN